MVCRRWRRRPPEVMRLPSERISRKARVVVQIAKAAMLKLANMPRKFLCWCRLNLMLKSATSAISPSVQIRSRASHLFRLFCATRPSTQILPNIIATTRYRIIEVIRLLIQLLLSVRQVVTTEPNWLTKVSKLSRMNCISVAMPVWYVNLT